MGLIIAILIALVMLAGLIVVGDLFLAGMIQAIKNRFHL